MQSRLILVGAGDFGRELINWINDVAVDSAEHKLSGFVDQNPSVLNQYSYRLPWLGTPDEFVPDSEDRFIVGIADPQTRCAVVEKLKAKGAVFATFVHPSAVIAGTARLGEGVVVCPQAFVSSDAVVGDHVIINGLCSIGHDVKIGNYVTMSAHVDLTGFVQVGEFAFFGTGAKVLPKVKIGRRARIGAGTTIVRSVPEDAVMYAVPAKRM